MNIYYLLSMGFQLVLDFQTKFECHFLYFLTVKKQNSIYWKLLNTVYPCFMSKYCLTIASTFFQ